MFGYACDETKELMPLPIQMAHQLAAKLAEVRKKKAKGIDWLRPDGKTQVSVRYEGGEVTGVEAIVVSTQPYVAESPAVMFAVEGPFTLSHVALG